MLKKIKHRLEELILFIIILLNVFEYIDLLPGDLELIKLFISWIILGYIIFKVGLTRILFSNEKVFLDIMIIIGYFLFIIKSFVAYSYLALDETVVFETLCKLAWNYRFEIEMYSFCLGGIILLAISVYMALALEIKKPSLMHVIHEEGKPPKTAKKLAFRFITIFCVLISFFVAVFNFAMDWIGIIADAPLVLFAIFFYLFIIIRHHKRLKVDSLIFKIGSFGEQFYEKFINLFRYKKTIFLGISGILVLHLLADVGTFIVPYILGFKEISYLGRVGGFQPIYLLFLGDISSVHGYTDKLFLLYSYVFNVLAILLLFLAPAFIWSRINRKKGFKISNIVLSLFFISLLVFMLMPILKIEPIRLGPIKSEIVAGVDILTWSIFDLNPFKLGLPVIFFISLSGGIIIFFLSSIHWFKEKIIAGSIIAIDIFFSIYIYYFSTSVIGSYAMLTNRALTLSVPVNFFIGFYLIIFLVITILFYVGGLFIFMLETKKEFRYIK